MCHRYKNVNVLFDMTELNFYISYVGECDEETEVLP